ncbi:DNA-binding protein [Paracoccus haeundaensis]|uniref:DNA-binding protein n=2 Tax=Paracoccus haeundaensis TaxID=225362 RepID=A0A5C4RBJ1_9RHOB|nr:DNA-binding protein [Paracoccus haeundaensis]
MNAHSNRFDRQPPLDSWRLDAILEPERKLWGLPMIAETLGVSVSKARDLASRPEVPIFRPEGSGSYFAFRSELMAWLRGKPGNDKL